jgi:hypothetical protein
MTLHVKIVAALLLGLCVSACASRNAPPPAAAMTEDDDAFCRQNGMTAGSDAYVACRKDRDVQRSNAVTRANRAQRNLGEMMLNNPENGLRR